MKNSLFIFICFCVIQISIQLEENNYNIEMEIDGFVSSSTIGKKGAIELKVSSSNTSIFDKDDIEEKTKFETTISNATNSNFTINCRLWRSDNSVYKLVIFCNLDETVPKGRYTVNIASTQLTYKEYNITILCRRNLLIDKVDYDIIQLYSEKQNITVEDGKESYEIKFKINAYNNEKIYFLKRRSLITPLDNCNLENRELKCLISKSLLDETIEENGEYFRIAYYTKEESFRRFELVELFNVYYLNIIKEDIYVSINKLIENVGGQNSYIVYETNVTDIPKFSSHLKKARFNFNNGDNEVKFSCGFKKYDNYPLFLFCAVSKEGNFTLSEIKENINLTDINIKYNFIILPVKNNETVICGDLTSDSLEYVSPDVLDFTSTNSLVIDFTFNDNHLRIWNVTFNQNSSYLQCEYSKYTLTCIVPKSHFKGKESGYYFLMHPNHLNNLSYLYEVSPIKVILPESETDQDSEQVPNSNSSNNTLIIILSIIVGIIIIGLIIFLVFYCKKKKLNSDSIENIKKNDNDMEILK